MRIWIILLTAMLLLSCSDDGILTGVRPEGEFVVDSISATLEYEWNDRLESYERIVEIYFEYHVLEWEGLPYYFKFFPEYPGNIFTVAYPSYCYCCYMDPGEHWSSRYRFNLDKYNYDYSALDSLNVFVSAGGYFLKSRRGYPCDPVRVKGYYSWADTLTVYFDDPI